jgi:hypothetical protein
LKKLILLLLFTASVVYSQTEYVRSENPVYNFLERMESLNILPDYNKFEIPKTRKDISGYIAQIILKKSDLDNSDKQLLNDFVVEFGFDLASATDAVIPDSVSSPLSIFGNSNNFNLFSDKEKYMYFYNDKGKANMFFSLFANGEVISYKPENSDNKSAFLGTIGGEVRGTFLDHFGFYIRGSNGNAFGDREAALQKEELKYSFKFNEKPDNTFFDETEGYLTADYDIIRFKIGRDRLNLGYGQNKPLLGNTAPIFDYVGMNIKYKFFTFSFFHGKLLGNSYDIVDSVTEVDHFVAEKYMAYHRLGLNLSKDVDFGIGEIVIYGERSIDLSYLNPFAFYKSIEHSNRDRDNAMLFADFNNNSISGLNIYSTLLVDDIDFGKVGKGWWGNEIMFNAGFYSSLLYKIIPLDFRLDYLRIEPYTFSHRLLRNNFTNYTYKLGADNADPNSYVLSGDFIYRLNHRLNISAGFVYSVHGANPVDASGNVLKNVGGSIQLGHRASDSETLHFLDGVLEYKRNITFSVNYEPINQYNIVAYADYANQSLQNGIKNNYFTFILSLGIKI